MKLRSLALAATALAVLAASPVQAKETTAARLFIADREAPTLTVVDLQAGAVETKIEMPAPAGYLLPGPGQRDLFAVHGAAGSVSLVDTGIALEDHGDHADLTVETPAVWPAIAEGPRPSHTLAKDGTVAVFLDGTGEALLIPAAELPALASPPVRVASGLPHHGVAVPVGENVLISIAEPQGERNVPVGLALKSRDGAEKAVFRDCPRLHGEAAIGPTVIAGCQDGVLAVTVAKDGTATARKLPYPKDAGDGPNNNARVWTLDPVPGMTAAMGEGGRDALFLVDPAGGEISRVALPGARVHAIPDPEVFAHALVLTADGTLHRVSLLDGSVAASAPVTGPVDLATRGGPPRPVVAATVGHVAVLDPLRREVVRLDAKTLKETGRIPLDGAPHRMMAAGGRGTVH